MEVKEDVIVRAKEWMPPEQVEVVVYHNPCPDGFGAAWCAYRFNPHIQLIPLRLYGQLADSHLFGKNVLFLDICQRADFMIYYRQLAKRLMVLDHHISSQRNLGQEPGFFFDDRHSAAILAWHYFGLENVMNQPLPRFLDLIEKGDLWKDDLDGRVFSFYSRFCMPMELREWDLLLDSAHLEGCLEKGRTLYQYEMQSLQQEKFRASHKGFLGHRVKILNTSSRMVNELGSELAKECDFCLLWYYNHYNNTCKVSLRSTGQVDVSKIAEQFGGGGHQCASSFCIEFPTLVSMLFG